MRSPDLAGATARAWRLPIPTDQPTALLTRWLVHAPWADSSYAWKLVAVVHLREEPGIPHSEKWDPDATHQLSILPVDPDDGFVPDPDKAEEGYPVLIPADIEEQFGPMTDTAASWMCDSFMSSVCMGTLIPDNKFRFTWEAAVHESVELALRGKSRGN